MEHFNGGNPRQREAGSAPRTPAGAISAKPPPGLPSDDENSFANAAHGIWKDTIFVEYRRSSDTEPRILEGDIIRLYGDFKGLKSYKAVLGQTITVPRVVASVIERQPSD